MDLDFDSALLSLYINEIQKSYKAAIIGRAMAAMDKLYGHENKKFAVFE